jgi:hypothetical protein
VLTVDLNGILDREKKAVLDRWFKQVADSYPAETSLFLASRQDRFANPVGAAVSGGLKGLLEGLLADADSEELAPYLDDIVRIRAVQKFSPSEAVSFIFALKGIIREIAAEEKGQGDPAGLEAMRAMEARIDRLALLAFDNYSACREKLFEIKLRELRDRLAMGAGVPFDGVTGACGAQGQELQGGTTMKQGES